MANHAEPERITDVYGYMQKRDARYSYTADGYTHINYIRFDEEYGVLDYIEGPRYQDMTSHGGKVD